MIGKMIRTYGYWTDSSAGLMSEMQCLESQLGLPVVLAIC